VLISFVLQFYDLWVFIKEPSVNLQSVLKVPRIVQKKQEVSRSFSVSYLLHSVIIIIIIIIIAVENNSSKQFIYPVLAHFTVTGKRKWLFVNGFEFKSPIFVGTEYSDSCQQA
jgi:hypothetical protein